MTKTILIVDDSTSLRVVVCAALQQAGYRVLEAEDGLQALVQLDGQKINLIISDVHMPHMDGIELLKHIRSNPHYKFVPVIMLTSEGADAVRKRGTDAGARAWLLKPFNPEQVLDAVAKLVLP